MKPLFILFLIIVALNNIYSQNYLTIKPDAVSYYFGVSDNSVSPIRIDSVKVYGDSTEYYSFCMLRPINNLGNYYTEKGPSWIGKKMVDCGNGMNLFFNKENDTIFIKTNAQLNQTWKMFSCSNGNYIDATISSFTVENFIGLGDSVKTISMQLKDMNGNNLTDQINSFQLKISKNYGFIVIADFYNFPFNLTPPTDDYGFNHLLSLIGLSNPQVGWQNITAADVFTMQPGDEIHYFYTHSNGPYPGAYSENRQIISKYLNRIEDSTHDTIIFTIERCQKSIVQNSSSNIVITHLHDTIQSTIITTNHNYNKLPLEPFYNGSMWGYYNKIDTFGYQPANVYWNANNDSLEPAPLDGWSTVYFTKNFGDNTYEDDNYYNGDVDLQVFHYYLVNGVSWGTPYDCDSLLAKLTPVKDEIDAELTIFPNPASNVLFISAKNENLFNCFVQINDLQGRFMLKKLISEKNQPFDISFIPAGVYMVKLTNQKTSTISKLIICR